MPNQLLESLFILDKCCERIQRLANSLEGAYIDDNPKQLSDEYLVDTAYSLILEAVSFLDEYHQFFGVATEPEHKERILELKRIAKPVIKKLESWKDLVQFRNNIVAHGWRDKGTFVLPLLSKYNIPRNSFEFTMLAHYFNYVRQLILGEFGREVVQAHQYVQQLGNVPTPPPPDYTALNKDAIALREEVNQTCFSLGKSYRLKIFLYYIDEHDADTEYDKYGYPIAKDPINESKM